MPFKFCIPQVQHRAWQSLSAHTVPVELKLSKTGTYKSQLLQKSLFPANFLQPILSRLNVEDETSVPLVREQISSGKEPAPMVQILFLLSPVPLTLS